MPNDLPPAAASGLGTLPPDLLPALVPLLVLIVALDIYCLVDLARAKSVRHLPKIVWAIVILFISAPIGALVYLFVGRDRGQDSGAAAGTGGGAVASRGPGADGDSGARAGAGAGAGHQTGEAADRHPGGQWPLHWRPRASPTRPAGGSADSPAACSSGSGSPVPWSASPSC